MILKKLFFSALVLFFAAVQLFAQCTLEASTTLADSLVCGNCVSLSAFGQGQGMIVFSETFDSGAPSGWAFTQQASFSNPCSPMGVDGTTHIWMGDQSGVPRTLETLDYDLTAATAGVTVCFDMLFAAQGDGTPCEGPDEPDEGVNLQYSINGGTSWIDINYFDPNGGDDPLLINWNNWCFQLPLAAITSATRIRWFQDNDSGADYDHWGIDNVSIYFNDATFEITWMHDGFSYGMGSSGGINPNEVCPLTTTTYTVNMSNGTSMCSDQITIPVRNPDVVATATMDQSICPGDCVDIFGTASVIESPAKTPTYENNELEVVSNSFGSLTEIGINVTGLNMDAVEPGSITEVCINQLSYFGFVFFPPGQEDVGDLNIYLQCPDGTQILLVPAGLTSGGSNPLTGGYTNTCFVPAGGGSIATGTSPYTGQWAPNQPLDNLVGCDPNGVWSIVLESQSALGLGSGTFFGWSISFDDPEISYPAVFSWDPSVALSDASILNPNACPISSTTYTLTVSDSAMCVTQTASVDITIDPACCPFIFDPSITQPSCGASDGAIDMNVLGGSGNFSFEWDNSNMTNMISGLNGGSYTITITDVDAACSRDTTIILSTAASPTLASTPTDASCGASDGQITIVASNGTAPYTYAWSNGQTAAIATALAAGSYTVTVSDANGCTLSLTDMVANAGGTISLGSSSTDNTLCGLTCNGSATITPSSGTAPYTYIWSEGSTTPSITNTCSGSYGVTVTDANGCSNTSTVMVNDNNNAPTLSSSSSDNTLCGTCNGSATITPSGGAIPYTFLWSDGSTTASLTNTCSGNYNVTVSDANFCTVTTSVSVLDNSGVISLSSSSVSNNTCAVSCGGSATVTPSGGTLPYTYNWSNGQTTQTATAVCGGAYGVTVTDANACSNAISVSVSDVGSTITFTDTNTDNTLCGLTCNGTAMITPIGGSAPYTFAWSDGQTTQTATAVCGGSYNVTVTDANGCTGTATSVVANNSSALTLSTNTGLISCSGAMDGSIDLTIVGGTAPFTYNWDNAPNIEDPSGLDAGTYNVTVTDANNCQGQTSASLTNPATFLLSISNDSDVSCPATMDGGATATLTGGSVPYTYLWSSGSVTASANNLIAGINTITVTDANGCSVSQNITMQIVNPVVTNVFSTDINCFGANNGIITAASSAGTSPYTYLWSTGFMESGLSSTVSNLTAGPYSVTITDANGCSFTTNASIQEPAAIVAVLNGSSPTCFNDLNGGATAAVSGGIPPYTYTWDNGETNATAVSLSAGNHNLTIVDASGCSQIEMINIAPASLVIPNLINPVPVSCFGGSDGSASASASGGTPPYNFLWSDGQTGTSATGLSAGIYDLTITDANNCLAPAISLTVTEPTSPIMVSLDSNPAVCFGENTGSANALAVGGIPSYTYLWSSGSIASNAIGLSQGIYTLTVNDQNGCSVTDTVSVNQPENLLGTIDLENVKCYGDNDGTITLDTTYGGVGPYAYSLDGTSYQTGDLFAGLYAGVYTLYIQDALGCESVIDNININELAELSLSLSDPAVIQLGDSSSILSTISQTNDLVYSWSPVDGLSCIDCPNPVAKPTESTEYTLSITDTLNDCTALETVQIDVRKNRNVYIPSGFSPNDDGVNDLFMVYGGTGVEQITLFKVYDRWGELMFEDANFLPNDPTHGWNGTFRNKFMNTSVFVYYVEVSFVDGEVIGYKGDVTLLR